MSALRTLSRSLLPSNLSEAARDRLKPVWRRRRQVHKDLLRARAVLAELEAFHTPQDVAGVLLSANVSGVRGSAASCPITRYLTQMSGGIVKGTTTAHEITLYGEYGIHLRVLIDPYGSVARFVRKFDLGEYPELVDVH